MHDGDDGLNNSHHGLAWINEKKTSSARFASSLPSRARGHLTCDNVLITVLTEHHAICFSSN